MAETRVIITAEADRAIQEFNRLRGEATQALNQIGRGGAWLDQVGVSARQTAASLRQVAPQFTDIIVSLQAGQNPLTVLLQQGGQLRDMFGSTSAAARALGGYVLSLINPYTLLAAGVGVVALAYYQGSKEADAYTRAIAMSGNAAGVSKDQLASMARSIRQAGETQGAAAEALAALVTTGKVGRENLEAFATTSIKAQKIIGQSVAETVKVFEDIGKSPVAASLRLNEQYNYLTASVYEQIRALESKGQVDAAAEIAQKAYAAAMDERIATLKANLGTLESAWAAVRGWAVSAWDAMLDIGRDETLDQKIESVKKKILKVRLEQMSFTGSSKENRAESDVRKAALQAELDGLTKKQKLEKQSNEEKAAAVALEQAKIKWSQDGEKFLTRQQQLENAIAKARAEGAAAGKSEQEIRERVAQVAASYSDIANDSINAQIEAIKRRGSVEDTITQRSMDLLVSKHNVGLVNERDFIAQVTQMDLAAFDRNKSRVQEELALTATKQNSEKDQAALRGQLAEIDAQRTRRKIQGENQLYELEVRAARLAADNTANVIEKQDDEARKLADQVTAQRDANDQIGLTKEGIVQLTAARLRERAALAEQNAEIAEGVDFSGQLAEKYRLQAQRLRELADAQVAGAAKSAVSDKFTPKDLEDYLDPSKAKSFGDSLKDAFGSAGDALVKLRVTMEDYGAAQTTVERARAAAAVAYANDSAKLAAANITISRKEAQARASAYGDMASSAKGFFSQHTAGYKVLQATEKAFRLYELALAAESMAKKILFKGSEVAANATLNATKLAGEAATSAASTTLAGTEASAWGITAVVKALASLPFPFNLAAGAATLAAVIAIGAKMTGGLGGGGGGQTAADVQKVQGTGSVFGDNSAKSDSIRRSIEQLQANSDIMLPINRGMLTALQNIESAMTGLTNLVVRTTGLTDGTNMGIEEGTASNVTGFVGNFMTHLNRALAGVIHGDQLTKALFGKTTQTIIDSGLQYGGSIRSLQAGDGFQQYASVDTTKKSLFGLKKSTSNRIEVADLSDELSNQFALIFSNLDSSLQAASIALGGSAADVTKVLDGLTLQSTKVSLKGLTGTALTDALNSVISKSMDEIAVAVFPQFESFRLVGEGYAETVLRIAGDYAKLDSILAASSTTFGATGIASVAARERLIELAGGVEQLATKSNSFVENFLSKAEQLAPAQKYVTEQLAAMGLQSLDTREKFKDYVQGLANSGALLVSGDITTRSQEQYLALLDLSDAFAKTHAATIDLTKSQQEIADERSGLMDRLNAATKTSTELLAMERAALDASNRALYDQVIAEEAAKEAAEALTKANEEAAAKRASIELNIAQLLGNTTLARERELAALPASARALQQYAYALADADQAVTLALSGVQRAIEAEKASIQSAADAQIASIRAGVEAGQASLAAAQKSVDSLSSIFDTINDAVKSLRTSVNAQANMGQARSFIDMALSVARAGGMPDAEKLRDAINTVTQDRRESYASTVDFEFAQLVQAGKLEALGVLARNQKSLAEQQFDTLTNANKLAEDQIKAIERATADQVKLLDAQWRAAQDAVSAMRGVDLSVKSVADSIASLNGTIVALAAVRNAASVATGISGTLPTTGTVVAPGGSGTAGGGASGESPASPGGAAALDLSVLSKAQRAYFDAIKGQAGDVTEKYKYVVDLLEVQALRSFEAITGVAVDSTESSDDYMRRHGYTVDPTATDPTKRYVPAFAGGGDHSGGLRVVGEVGPELEATGPSRIWSFEQTRRMLSGGGNSEQVTDLMQMMIQQNDRLEQQNKRLEARLAAIEANTGRTTGMIDQVTSGGNAARVEVVRSLVEAG